MAFQTKKEKSKEECAGYCIFFVFLPLKQKDEVLFTLLISSLQIASYKAIYPPQILISGSFSGCIWHKFFLKPCAIALEHTFKLKI